MKVLRAHMLFTPSFGTPTNSQKSERDFWAASRPTFLVPNLFCLTLYFWSNFTSGFCWCSTKYQGIPVENPPPLRGRFLK